MTDDNNKRDFHRPGEFFDEDDAEENQNSNENRTTEAIADVTDKRTSRKKSEDSIAGSSADNDIPKREENPFSFKHFLNRDSKSYQSTNMSGPKVSPSLSCNYTHGNIESSATSSHHSRNSVQRQSSEISTVLPDFVQDHLVVEQCYLNHSGEAHTPPSLSVDLENLPDFALSDVASGISPCNNTQYRLWGNEQMSIGQLLPDATCDLTGSTSNRSSSRQRSDVASIPFDLPSFERNSNSSNSAVDNVGGLPFDLPLVTESRDRVNCVSQDTRDDSQLAELGVSKSLPDFLSDGPIHSDRHNDVSPPSDLTLNTLPGDHSAESHNSRLVTINERLTRELEITRRQLAHQIRRTSSLEREVQTFRSNEHAEAAALDKAMKQVEDNLKRTTKRAAVAENMVSKLKKDIEVLNNELSALRRENEELRMGGGACSSSGTSSHQYSYERRTRVIAQDLRVASDTAEQSLRQLLSGISNLRVMASALENIDKIQDTSDCGFEDKYKDDDEDDGASSL